MTVDLGSAHGKIVIDSSGVKTGVDEATGSLGGLQSAAGVAAGAVTAVFVAAAAAVAAVGVASVNAAADMQEATNAIIVGTGASGESLAEMENIAKSLKGSSAGLGVEMGTLGSVIAEVNTRTGLTGAALETMSAQVLELTRLTGGDAVRNTQLITRVMGDWGVASEDSAALMDQLFGAGQAFGIGVEDLSQKVVQFGAPMRQMGFSLEESIALFGKWEKEGVNAELAIGSLRIAAGKFAREGVPLQEGLRDTMAAIQGTTDESEALAIAMDVFGARAGPDMAAAIREGRFELDSAIEALQGTSGGLEDAASRALTTADRFEIMKNRVSVALIPIGEVILSLAERMIPLLEDAFTQLQPIITAVAAALEQMIGGDVRGGLESIFGEEMAAKIMNVGAQIGEFIARAQEVLAPILEMVAGFVTWKDVLIAAGIAIGAVVVAAVIALIQALAPVIAVIALVIGAVALMRNAWENNLGGIQEKTAAVLGFLQNLITTVITAVKDFWAANGDEILAKANEIWSAIQLAIETAIAIISEVIQTTLAAIQVFWAENGEAIIAKANEIWTIIVDYLTGIFETIKTIFEAFALAFEGDWRGFGEKLREAWETFWTTILNYLSGLWGLVQPILQSLADSIISFFTTTDWQQLGDSIIDGIVNGISAGAGAIADAAQAAAQAALDAAKGFLGIESPSKAFLEVGRNINAGLAAGLADDRAVLAAMAGNMRSLTAVATGSQQRQTAENRVINVFGPAFPNVTRGRDVLTELEGLG